MAIRPVQSYTSHAHRPTLTTIATACLVVSITGFAFRWFLIGGRVTMAIGLAGLIGAVSVLILISRAYTVKLQDRIIRLEVRMRAQRLLTPEQQRTLDQFGMKHLAALRFASDGELGHLVDRAAKEKLAPDDIKRAVTNWVGDYDRT